MIPWLAVVALALCNTAWAAPKFTEAQVMGRLHADLDLDGDGKVSLSEFEEVSEERHFADLDRDGSGGISVSELQTWVMLTPPRPERNRSIKPINRPVQAQPTDGSGAPVQPPAPNSPPQQGGSPNSPPQQGGTPVAPPRNVPPPPPPPQPVQVPLAQASGTSNLQIAAVSAGVVGLGALFAGVWVSRGGTGRRRRRRR